MKKNINIYLLSILFIILSTSCKPTPIATMPPTNSLDWWTTWLTQPTCQPPCWENITPGVTTQEEATSILKGMTDITIKYNGENGLTWYFGEKSEGGFIVVSNEGKVDRITLENTSNKNWNLEKIVTVYSFPKYLEPFDCRDGMCIVSLVYPDLGMFLDVFVENKGANSGSKQFEIFPDTIVDRVYFIEQGIENFKKIPGFEEDALLNWKGYGKYP